MALRWETVGRCAYAHEEVLVNKLTRCLDGVNERKRKTLYRTNHLPCSDEKEGKMKASIPIDLSHFVSS